MGTLNIVQYYYFVHVGFKFKLTYELHTDGNIFGNFDILSLLTTTTVTMTLAVTLTLTMARAFKVAVNG